MHRSAWFRSSTSIWRRVQIAARFMEEQFARLGIAAERVEAMTPADLPEITRQRQAALPVNAASPPTRSPAAPSHRKAWRLMLERGAPCALFMEDDGVLSGHLPAILDDPALLAPAIDALQFETHRTSALLGRSVPTPQSGVVKQRLMSSSLGGAATSSPAPLRPNSSPIRASTMSATTC